VRKIPTPEISFLARTYICCRSESLNIDGILDEDGWEMAAWTEDFVDIEGDSKAFPLFRTRAKMLWDNEYFYVAAEITEPHIQARLRQRDTVIFYDNDFEVFIDPDGDSHGYYELELNAYNTVWDLLLTKPYRDEGCRVLDAWDIKDLKSAVRIYGTLNDPTDLDEGWTVEMAIPLDVLSEWGNTPSEGTQWRINFSRVNWRTAVLNGSYHKETDPSTGESYPEYNWVWSPQGLINMHYPEMWGFVQFTENMVGLAEPDFIHNPDEEIKWELRKLYYAQREYAANNGAYTSVIEDLNKLPDYNLNENIDILINHTGYEAYMKSEYSGLTWIINNSGRIYRI